MYTYCTFNFDPFFLEEKSIGGFCPTSHSFAYLNGHYCCKTKEERQVGGCCHETPQSEIEDGTCDGIEFNRQSVCCYNEQWVTCPYSSGCDDNPGMYNYLKCTIRVNFKVFNVQKTRTLCSICRRV